MSNLLDITGDDIARLNDVDLRALIGLLCEADYRLAGLPTKGITWGGHQDARDGGLDDHLEKIPDYNTRLCELESACLSDRIMQE